MSSCYELIKDALTLLSPFVIALYVYRQTAGDVKREAKLKALYKLHESVNSVRYAHGLFKTLFESKNHQCGSVSNEYFAEQLRARNYATR